jgi:hypothetical protein
LSPFVLQIYGPDGDLLHHESLYEFLRRIYVPVWHADEFRFEEMEFVLNGAPLLPRSQGNA